MLIADAGLTGPVRDKLRMTLLVSAVLALTLLFVYLIRSGYREAIDAAATTTRNYAAIMNARLDATLRRAENDLDELARIIPDEALNAGAVPRHNRRIEIELRSQLQQFPELADYAVVDAAGNIIYTTANNAAPPRSVADRHYFGVLRDTPSIGLVFSEVFISRARGKPILVAARALRNGAGAFRGVVLATVDLEYFQHLFQQMAIGARGTIAIFRSDDFTRVVRWPQADDNLNVPLPPDSPTRAAMVSGAGSGTVEFAVSVDGTTRVYSNHALGRYPFFVSVGFARDDVLADWRVRSVTVSLSALVILLGLALALHRLRRADAALKVSAAVMRSTFEQAAVGIANIDVATRRFLIANDKFCELVGYARDELTGMDSIAISPAEDMSARDHEKMQIVEGKIQMSYGERRMVRKDGSLRWVNRSLSLVRDAAGNPDYFIAFIEDISERKRAEAENRNLSRAVEQSPASILITDRAGNIEYVNSRFVQVTGYAREEVAGRNPRILKSGLTPPALYEELWAAILTGSEWRGELCNRRKNGELFWESASVSGVKDENGVVQHYIAVKEDLTERKRNDEKLRASESRLAAVFQASPVALCIMRTGDGRLLETNDAMLQLFGRSRDELVGPQSVDLGIYLDPSQHANMIAQLNARGDIARFHLDMRLNGSDSGIIEASGRTIDLQGEACAILVMVDVTDRKRLEQGHLQAQKLESLGTLAGGIAHDFNNILAAICGNADLVAEDIGPDHISTESIQEIRNGGARATELVRRIMAFGRPREPQQKSVDLAAVTDEVLKLLRSTLPAGILLKKNFSEDTPVVLADSGQIHEVIVNLTTNAAYAIGARAGSIEYRLEALEVNGKFAEDIGDLKPGRYARLTVSDSGSGMSAETMGRIFDAFYTTKPAGVGVGLGLSMVHGIMRSHGGAVAVESTPGKGSSFALYFPAAPHQTRDKVGIEGSHVVRSAGKRVLYVDDEEALVSLIRRAFERLGYRIMAFTAPAEALAEFRAHPQDFDVVVTDATMPGMSGFELVREVLELRPGIPVLMTTGYIGAEEERLARISGICELVLKPVSVNEFVRLLNRLFDGA